MKNGISLMVMASLAMLTVNAANADSKLVEDTKKVGGGIKHGAEKVGSGIKTGAEKAGEATVSGAKKVGGGIKHGAEKVGSGAKKVGEGVAEHMPGHKKADTTAPATGK